MFLVVCPQKRERIYNTVYCLMLWCTADAREMRIRLKEGHRGGESAAVLVPLLLYEECT